MTPLVAFSRVRKCYGDRVALQGLSLEIGPGEIFGLLGPNGAGKTTAIRMLMDIIRPDSGVISLFGKPPSSTTLDEVAYLPEERGLYTKQSVLEVMSYFGALKGLRDGEARARARVWLDRVGLRDCESTPVERLSKGMSQKVQLAVALQSEPKLAILDEPFSGLDPVNANHVRELIRQVKRSGRTAILSTHQMNMVDSLCDRVALLSKGALVVYGSVAEVRSLHSRAELLVVIDGKLPKLQGVELLEQKEGVCRLLLAQELEPQSVLAELVRLRVRVHRFEPVVASMEDIFIRHIGEAGSPGALDASG